MLSLVKNFFGTKKFIKSTPAKRVGLDVNHNILLFVREKSFRINNISSSGLGFLIEGHQHFQVGEEIMAEIEVFNVGELKFKMKIVHMTNKLVGCQVTEPVEAYAHLVDDYFESELSAKYLDSFSSDQLKNSLLGAPLLFRGKDCELYLIHQEKNLISFKLIYKGNIVERNKDGQILVSLIYGNNSVAAADVPPELGEKCTRFVSSIDTLSNDLKNKIVNYIRQSVESGKLTG